MTEETSIWCAYHLIHVQTPHQHIPKLVITDVPEGETVAADLLERAGYQFGEFNIPWANHVLERVDAKESPADLVARIRQGEGEWVTYADLKAKAEAPL
jgi:hypothetical protein